MRLRLEQVALPVPPLYRVAPDDPAGPLADRKPLGGEVAAIVVDDGHVTGIVTTRDLWRELRRKSLTSR